MALRRFSYSGRNPSQRNCGQAHFVQPPWPLSIPIAPGVCCDCGPSPVWPHVQRLFGPFGLVPLVDLVTCFVVMIRLLLRPLLAVAYSSLGFFGAFVSQYGVLHLAHRSGLPDCRGVHLWPQQRQWCSMFSRHFGHLMTVRSLSIRPQAPHLLLQGFEPLVGAVGRVYRGTLHLVEARTDLPLP